MVGNSVKDYLRAFKLQFAVIAIAAVLVIASTANVYSVSSSNTTTYNKFTSVAGCNYLVFSDGITTYAKNCNTGSIDYIGTTTSTVIQSAIDALSSGSKLIIRDVSSYGSTLVLNSDNSIEIEIQSRITYTGTGYAIKLTNGTQDCKIDGVGRITLTSSASGGILLEDSNYNHIDFEVVGANRADGQMGIMIDRTSSGTAAYWNTIDSKYIANVDTGIKLGNETHARANANHIGDVVIRTVKTGIDFNYSQGSVAENADIEGFDTQAVRNNDIQNHVLSARGEKDTGATAYFVNTANANSFYYVLKDTTASPKISNANTTIQGVLVEGSQVRTFGSVIQRAPNIIVLFHNETGIRLSPASTSYTATNVLDHLRTKFPFDIYRPLNCRVVVVAQGSESGNGKGIEVRNLTDSSQLCEVTWNGNTLQNPLAGSWTGINTSAEKTLQIRAKGSSNTETITLYHLELQFY